MLEHVNIRSSVAVYVQIENQVRFGIASGNLKAGNKLPSVQELSKRLSLNANTMAKAYRDLEVMGLVYTRRGMGVYINKGVEAECRETVRCEVVDHIYEAVSEARAAGMTAKEVCGCVEKLYGAVGEPYGVDEALVRGLAKGK